MFGHRILSFGEIRWIEHSNEGHAGFEAQVPRIDGISERPTHDVSHAGTVWQTARAKVGPAWGKQPTLTGSTPVPVKSPGLQSRAERVQVPLTGNADASVPPFTGFVLRWDRCP